MSLCYIAYVIVSVVVMCGLCYELHKSEKRWLELFNAKVQSESDYQKWLKDYMEICTKQEELIGLLKKQIEVLEKRKPIKGKK